MRNKVGNTYKLKNTQQIFNISIRRRSKWNKKEINYIFNVKLIKKVNLRKKNGENSNFLNKINKNN